MNNFNSRVKAARLARGLSQTELAEAAGISQTTVAQVESGRNSGSKFVLQIARALGVDGDWLLTGEGLMDNGQWDSVRGQPKYRTSSLNQPRLRAEINILDLYDFDSEKEGIKWNLVHEQAYGIPDEVFRQVGSVVRNCRLVITATDEMDPYLASNDIFMLDQTKTDIRDGRIYLIDFENDIFLRQILKQAGGSVVLHANNPRHKDKEVPADHVGSLKILGQCVFRAGAITGA